MSLWSAAECLLLTTMPYTAGLVALRECPGLQQWIAITQASVNTTLFFVHPLARGSLIQPWHSIGMFSL
jgi:hypothetical protein